MNIDTEIELERLREKIALQQLTIGELRAEAAAAKRALVEYASAPQSWLQRKVWRQARALEKLQRRVERQRFVLRNLERLGRGLSDEELANARALEGRTVVEAVA